jgi:uncharacterized membrane protein (DUF2068 family)
MKAARVPALSFLLFVSSAILLPMEVKAVKHFISWSLVMVLGIWLILNRAGAFRGAK